MAAGLEARMCEIYTDVEGIYTADPRVVPNARKLDEIGYEEMLELAGHGAKMNPRSIELGRNVQCAHNGGLQLCRRARNFDTLRN